MLEKVGNLGEMFGQKRSSHPLMDARELKRILDDLPKDNAFKALDEIVGWAESLQAEAALPADRLFEVLRQLDEAGQPHVARLTRDYLLQPRLSRTEERRLWSIVHGFWIQLADGYERCLRLVGERAGTAFRGVLPLLCARLVIALGASLKWTQFHYGPMSGDIWGRLGYACQQAELAGVADKPVQAYPASSRMAGVRQEYARVLAFHAASMDSLLPLEIDLAERLILHFLSGFVFGPQYREDSVYWVDLAQPQPPMRLARMPQQASPTLRFFQPGSAPADMARLVGELEQGRDLPPEINLGAQYPVRTVLPVLRHLASHLAPIPPQRSHDRHRVKHRMSVLNGLINAFVVFSGEFGGRPAGLQMESWVVENVSRGGFGASLNAGQADWLRVGVLLALQPEGGDNWLLGIVRRYRRESEEVAQVGIETLARQAVSVEMHPRAASSYAAAAGVPALWIQDGNVPGEVRVVLPPASFDLREQMEFDWQGRRHRLEPLALVEHTPDYEVARYRTLAAA